MSVYEDAFDAPLLASPWRTTLASHQSISSSPSRPIFIKHAPHPHRPGYVLLLTDMSSVYLDVLPAPGVPSRLSEVARAEAEAEAGRGVKSNGKGKSKGKGGDSGGFDIGDDIIARSEKALKDVEALCEAVGRHAGDDAQGGMEVEMRSHDYHDAVLAMSSDTFSWLFNLTVAALLSRSRELKGRQPFEILASQLLAPLASLLLETNGITIKAKSSPAELVHALISSPTFTQHMAQHHNAPPGSKRPGARAGRSNSPTTSPTRTSKPRSAVREPSKGIATATGRKKVEQAEEEEEEEEYRSDEADDIEPDRSRSRSLSQSPRHQTRRHSATPKNSPPKRMGKGGIEAKRRDQSDGHDAGIKEDEAGDEDMDAAEDDEVSGEGSAAAKRRNKGSVGRLGRGGRGARGRVQRTIQSDEDEGEDEEGGVGDEENDPPARVGKKNISRGGGSDIDNDDEGEGEDENEKQGVEASNLSPSPTPPAPTQTQSSQKSKKERERQEEEQMRKRQEEMKRKMAEGGAGGGGSGGGGNLGRRRLRR